VCEPYLAPGGERQESAKRAAEHRRRDASEKAALIVATWKPSFPVITWEELRVRRPC